VAEDDRILVDQALARTAAIQWAEVVAPQTQGRSLTICWATSWE